MLLYFLRHGDAAPAGRLSDADRPLTELGFAQARTAGGLLRRAGVQPELVLASPLLRARQTAETACAELNVKGFDVTELLDPGADQRQLFAELKKRRAGSVLIVGHQPFIGEAVSLLLAGHRDIHVEIDKGTCVEVIIADDVKPGEGILTALLPHRFTNGSPT